MTDEELGARGWELGTGKFRLVSPTPISQLLAPSPFHHPPKPALTAPLTRLLPVRFFSVCIVTITGSGC